MVNMGDDVTVENVENYKPEGADFHVPLPNGDAIWFKDFQQGQRLMLVRASEIAGADRVRIQGGPGTDVEKFDALTKLSLKADKRMWDAIDSRVVNPDDIDKIMDAMICGDIDITWAWKVFRGGVEVPEIIDDDVEPIKEVKPSRRANAKRTQIR